MARSVGGMQRRAFRKSLRQQIGSVLAEYLRDGGGVQYVAMNRILSPAGQLIVYRSSERLGSKPAMHEPLLVPDGFESGRGDLGGRRRIRRRAEGSEAVL